MNKLSTLLLWSSVFILLSFTNFSGLCKHGLQNNEFGWKSTHRVQKNYQDIIPFNTALTHATPAKLTWEMLKNISLQKRWNKEYEMDILYPVFGKNIKKHAGKEMYITGYMIPLDIQAGLYAISKYNYASCFFCGGAGPESIVSLKFKNKTRRYKTDEYLTMKGMLELNDTNIGDFVYIFRNTEEFKEQ